MAFSNRELLARLIKCEAGGEGLTGMKAVGTVVMNRVRVPNGEYQRVGQGSLKKILNQRYQFDCMRSVIQGRFNPQNIWANPPESIHYRAADYVLSGNRILTVGYALWYYNPFNPICAYIFPRSGTGRYVNRIQKHCFYNPTRLYYST